MSGTAPPVPAGPGSLRRRLLSLLLGVTAVAWLATSVIGYLNARHETEEILDAHLTQTAGLLLAQPGGELEEIDTEHAAVLHRYGTKVAFQVWDKGLRLRIHSANAPNAPLSSVQEGFSNATHDGARWRVFSAWDARHETLVQVAEREDARADISNALGIGLAGSLFVVLPFLAMALWLAVGRGLQPLQALRTELGRREPEHLKPLPTHNAPEEVRPLVEEMNRLFQRMEELIARERRFTADASHELRTPLAVLRVQAQLARTTAAEDVRNEALDNLVAGVERATRLVDQLLTLARLEAAQPGDEASLREEACDLHEIVRQEAASATPRALARNVDLVLETEGPVPVRGQPELLAILARNLIDNSVRYAPPGEEAVLSVRPNALGEIVLAVRNGGAAIEPGDCDRLGERFHRVAGNDEPGSGIGLSIVRRIVARHRGQITFAPGASRDGRPGGLQVTVTLPAP
jgi:two-component system sensor histidine kinase QseC